jgi:hypothetical protein
MIFTASVRNILDKPSHILILPEAERARLGNVIKINVVSGIGQQWIEKVPSLSVSIYWVHCNTGMV